VLAGAAVEGAAAADVSAGGGAVAPVGDVGVGGLPPQPMAPANTNGATLVTFSMRCQRIIISASSSDRSIGGWAS
jgi:hypothetical protein